VDEQDHRGRQIEDLNSSLKIEQAARESAEANYSAEQARHSQTTNELSSQRECSIFWKESWSDTQTELVQVKSALNQANSAIMYLNSRVASLEFEKPEYAHRNCVTKSSVQTLIGSYRRLIDIADKYTPKTAWYTKAHYPDGLGSTSNGKLEVLFSTYKG
jgi:chromosome segregation ATPase